LRYGVSGLVVDVQVTLCLAYSERRGSVYKPYSVHSELQSIPIQALGSDVVCFEVGRAGCQGYETTVISGERRKSLWRLRLKILYRDDRPKD
jgi:hypothetical protein